MQIWAESGKSALPICNYSQILYQFLTFTQNLKRSLSVCARQLLKPPCTERYARWCERTAVSHRLLLDSNTKRRASKSPAFVV